MLLAWRTLMRFSILHISDLHRDLSDEINNKWLLDSLDKDFDQFDQQEPRIIKPTLCIISGDLVFGIRPGIANPKEEIKRQYTQAEEFLIGLADRFFEGKRDRLVILPGNHDVSYDKVMASAVEIAIPSDGARKSELVAELFSPNSHLRWSWRDLCFYRIIDRNLYDERLEQFAATYEAFYLRQRTFPLVPQDQYGIFDFPEFGFCVAALNSCFNNDPLRRAGAFDPTALTNACRGLRESRRAGWLAAAAWHHSVAGGPTLDDYLDSQFLQVLIDAGVSLAFHGHQHMPECFDERYRIGPKSRKITIVSASTLCADPHNLKPGVPRSFNVVELDTNAWTGRVHQRQMINMLFDLPVWGPGHFNASNRSYFDFELCPPPINRPAQLDLQITLDRADRSLGERRWQDAVDLLATIKERPQARPLLLKGLAELDDPRTTITVLWPPQTIAEIVMVGGAILKSGIRNEAEAFLELPSVAGCTDASVREVKQRITGRWLR